MNKISVIGLDLEDYYGTAIENIDFESPIELDPEEFDVRVDSFSYAGSETDSEGYIVRIQYEHEGSTGNAEDVELAHEQIMEILLESCDGELENRNEISKRIIKALEIII
jgi:hypothetical protein